MVLLDLARRARRGRGEMFGAIVDGERSSIAAGRDAHNSPGAPRVQAECRGLASICHAWPDVGVSRPVNKLSMLRAMETGCPSQEGAVRAVRSDYRDSQRAAVEGGQRQIDLRQPCQARDAEQAEGPGAEFSECF